MTGTFKIGVMIESFRCGLRGGLEAAASLGVQGVQLYATGGETHFAKLRGPALSELKRMLADLHLEMAAVCGDFGGHGFQLAEHNPKRIDDSMRVVDLALALDCRVVTTHIGVVPADRRHPRYVAMARACEQLGRFAAERDATFAIETGPEPAAVLRAFLDDINIPGGLGVNFDPANLVMVCREDIPAAVRALGPYVVHTHAKDGVNLQPVDPEMLYGAFAGDKHPDFRWQDYIAEKPLGAGHVPFPAYLAALREAGFGGYLTIEREVGEDPRRDIAAAVDFLRSAMAG
jgi:sugar phosphate isomerase/epimerase